MEKTIKLAGRDYKLKASLGTIIKYREVFGSELFGDVKLLDGLKDKSEEEVSKIIDVIFRITYILYRPYTSKSYDEFLDDFDFSIISDVDSLQLLAKTIGELLTPYKEGSKSPSNP